MSSSLNSVEMSTRVFLHRHVSSSRHLGVTSKNLHRPKWCLRPHVSICVPWAHVTHDVSTVSLPTIRHFDPSTIVHLPFPEFDKCVCVHVLLAFLAFDVQLPKIVHKSFFLFVSVAGAHKYTSETDIFVVSLFDDSSIKLPIHEISHIV